MLTLPAELEAQQTAKTRRPIIEVTAGRLTADFPLAGSAIANPDSQSQDVSASLFLADGRYVVFYAGYYAESPYAGPLRQLRMLVTDIEVTEFSDYVANYSDTSFRRINYLDAIAIDDTTTGVVAQLGDDRLAIFTISDAGVRLTEVQLTDLTTLHGAAVVKTDTGYGLIYIQESGGSYYIYRRTSSDFVTWSTATAISISNLDSSHPVQQPRLIRLADSTCLLIYSYATVFSTDATVFNLQYATSTDLATWSDSVPITNNSEVQIDYVYPDIIQKPDGSIFIAAQQSSTYLELTTSSSGWNTTDDIGPTNVWIDPAAGKAYLTSFYPGTGTKRFYGACRIDIDNWSIDAFYDGNTVPAVPAPLLGVSCTPVDRNFISDGKATIHTNTFGVVSVIDFAANRITGYYLRDKSSYGESYAQNVDVSALDDFIGYPYNSTYYTVFTTVADNKLWLIAEKTNSVYWTKVAICSIDLSAVTPPYELVVVATAYISGAGQPVDSYAFQVHPEQQLALYGSRNLANYEGCLVVLDLATGAVLKHYHVSEYQDFPHCGVAQVALVGDTIWAVPWYDAGYAPASDDQKWGLISIDLKTDDIEYYYPPWLSNPGYYFSSIVANEDDSELILGRNDGVAVFNYVSKTWEQLTNNVVEGLPPTNEAAYSAAPGVAYDRTRRVFIYGSRNHVYLVPRGGEIKTIDYLVGTDFVFTDPAAMVEGYTDAMPSLALTGDTAYLSWTETSGTPTINWAKEDPRLDITKYLLGGQDNPWQKAVSKAGSFSCELSHGHLFEKHNDRSLLRPYLQRGRTLTIREGERIGGVDWWAEQGTYVITGGSVPYRLEEYPVYRVECRDPSYLWDNNYIPAISVVGKTPEQALPQIITSYTGISSENIIVPSMPLRVPFDLSLLDTPLRETVTKIAERFQHFAYWRPDGKLEFRPYDFSREPNNSWSNIISWEDDEPVEEDMVNTWVVTGRSLEDFMVTYAEERLATKNGTNGWWGCKNEHIIYFSDDQQKMARHPRLVKLESSTSALFKLAGKIKEYISYEDPYNKYVEVKIETPSLVPLLLSAIAMYATGNAIGDIAPTTGGLTGPLGRKIEGAGLMLAMSVLGSVANWQFEIWGCPIGYTKRSYSANAADKELLAEVGHAVRDEIEGFLCHSQQHCQTVVNFIRDIAVASRKAVTITHPRDLRDEPGDIVWAKHPESGVYKKVFIESLRRSHKKRTGKATGGGLIDTARVWVLS